jgi:PhnB protein
MANKNPDGFHTVTPHITVKGAAAAIDFYQMAFGAELVMRIDGPSGAVMHAELKIGDSIILMNDENPQWNKAPTTLGGTSVCLALYAEDCDALFARATAAGAKPVMPPTNMFWGDRFSKVVDPFGHEWSISTHIEDVTPEECSRRAAEFFKQMASGGGGGC